jgi:hypothetical protein
VKKALAIVGGGVIWFAVYWLWDVPAIGERFVIIKWPSGTGKGCLASLSGCAWLLGFYRYFPAD